MTKWKEERLVVLTGRVAGVTIYQKLFSKNYLAKKCLLSTESRQLENPFSP